MKESILKRRWLINPYGFSLHLRKLKPLFLIILCLISLNLFAQQRISGKVTSKDAPLEGVTVQVKGGTTATQTNASGNFTITAPSNATLIITNVGYVNQEVKVGGRSSISVQLEPSTTQLTDVVVVGYGVQKKVTVTGSVATVKGAELEKSPTVNLSNSLAGRLPGITAINASGEPGFDGSTIRIRGTNTNGNSSALIVIDGVPDRAGGLDRLNPADIESMSVLKDASAAIYGSRAANGVILITTKQGKTGKPLITYDFNKGWSQPTRIPKMSNAVEYTELLNEQTLFSAIPVDQWSAAWDSFKKTGSYKRTDNNVTVNAPFQPTDVQKYADGSDPWGHPNTDWFKDAFKTWAPQDKHDLQISGGSEAVRFLASMGYENQDAYYKNSATGYKQYDMRINLDAKVNKYINTNVGITAREEYRFFPTVGAGDIFRMLVRGKPTEPEIWPNGLPGPDIENGQNPIVITTNQTGYDRNKRDYFQTNGKLEIGNPWIQGLKVSFTAAADKYIGSSKRFETPWYLYNWDKKTYEADGKTPLLTKSIRSTFSDPRLRLTSENELRINLTGLVNYDRTFGDHTINLLGGITKETRSGDNFFAFRRYFISPAVDQLFAGGNAEQNTGNNGSSSTAIFGSQARLSYFGRAAYNYKEKYLAEFLWRYDGSYIFPENKRFGFFPGILVGWNISKESFFNLPVFNNLKLRASYGQLGNDRVAEYQYLPNYGLGTQVINSTVQTTLREPIVPNPSITWEVANNSDVGLEGSLLNGRLSFELDYFYNKRTKLLIARGNSTPQTSGISDILPTINAGRLDNHGYEFRVAYNGKAGDVTFNVSVNGGYAKNKLVFFDEAPGIPDYQKATGRSYGTNGQNYLAYVYDGVFRDAKEIAANTLDYSAATGKLQPGDMKFKDVNGDGKINADDRVRLDQNRDPTFTGGINMGVQYKNFDLSALFQGATGGLLLFNSNETGDFGNYYQWSYEHRWSVENPSSVDPRLANRDNTYYTNNGNSFGANTYFLRSSNYLRLKNIELAYNFSSIGKKIGISRLRLYVNALNLLTWDKMKLFDPESTSSSGKYYPQARIINTGVRVTF